MLAYYKNPGQKKPRVYRLKAKKEPLTIYCSKYHEKIHSCWEKIPALGPQPVYLQCFGGGWSQTKQS